MTNTVSKFLFLLTLAGFFYSCSPKIAFTPELRSKLEYQGIDISDVQFYNSKKIVLNREEVIPEEVQVEYGEVKIENRRIIEEIVIKKNTPGICVQVNPYDINISFESNSSKTLKFSRKNKYRLEPSYRLYAENWKNTIGKIIYGDTLYQTQPGAGNVILLVKKKQFYNLIQQKRIVRGQKIGAY
ncbi:MAG: hypothetical protein U9R32_07880 [Bacteroidota bacterium]|nr:hypothetical protein [Bacteroidota bacterium]